VSSNNGPASVKICGIQHTAMLEAAAHLPIDHIGFVFAKSKRQVTPEQAGELIRYMRENQSSGAAVPDAVGVFVNPTQEELIHTLKVAPLDIVQLHGQETPEFCRWVKEHLQVQVFKVMSVQRSDKAIPSITLISVQLDPYLGAIDGLLLDTHDPIYGGGSGVPFAWDCIPVYKSWTQAAGIKLLVAGGLSPENVSELVEAYNPDGVDVSSGVETDGVKDIHKIAAFVERVKHCGTSA
jgi:phosphoribosylanthranilate isomerase